MIGRRPAHSICSAACTPDRVVYYQERAYAVLYRPSTVSGKTRDIAPCLWPAFRSVLASHGYRFVATDFANPDPQDRR